MRFKVGENVLVVRNLRKDSLLLFKDKIGRINSFFTLEGENGYNITFKDFGPQLYFFKECQLMPVKSWTSETL